MCVFYNAHPSSKPAKTRVIVFMETMTWLVSKSEATVLMSSLGFPDSSVGKESACNAGDSGSVPGTGRSAGEGIGYPFQSIFSGFPCGSAGKESACNAGDLG